MTSSFYPAHLGAMIVLLILLTGLVFWGMLAYGASRNGQSGNRWPAPWLLAGIAGWFGMVMVLVFNGAATTASGPLGLPNLVLVMSPPIAIGLLALRHSGFRRMLDGIPLALLAGFHLLRAFFGLFFLALYEMGAIPAVFAFRGGYGDMAAGVLGGLAALLLALGVRPQVTFPVLVLLTVEGLLDFALVLYTGLTAMPVDGPFQGFHPFFLIPALAVPLFILAHAYAIRAMWPALLGAPSRGPLRSPLRAPSRAMLRKRGADSTARPAPIKQGSHA